MAMTFTPIHQQTLALVRDGYIAWCNKTGPLGGFGHADGRRIPPSADLVALYELRDAQLIVVDRQSGRVTITTAGLNVLLTKR